MRVGVLRTDRLGDAVLTLPLFGVLRKDPGIRHTIALTTAYTAPVFQGHPWVDTVAVLPLRPRENPSPPVIRRLREQLRSLELDVLLLPFCKPGLALTARLAGIPVRVGPRRLYAWVTLTHRVALPADLPLHEVERTIRYYEVWRGRTVEDPPDPWIPVPPERKKKAEELWSGTDPRHRIVVHPRSGGTARSWPEHRFRDLSRWLVQEGYHVVWTGSGRDRREGITLLRTGVRDLRGKLSLQDLMALLSGATLMIAPATGPLHLAAALGTPVVGLYDPTHRNHAPRWAPRGAASRVLGLELPSLEHLELHAVQDAVLEMLQTTGEP